MEIVNVRASSVTGDLCREYFRDKYPKVILNLGNSDNQCIPLDIDRSLVVNKPGSVAMCSNKTLSLKVLSEAGVNVPELVNADIDIVVHVKDEPRPIRVSLIERFPDGIEYATRFVDKVKEWRVLMFFGKPFRFFEKIPKTECFNWDHDGADFKWKPLKTMPTGLSEICEKAATTLEIDLAGIDVGMTEDGTFYVFEVNSAPGMNEDTLKWLDYRLEKKYGDANMADDPDDITRQDCDICPHCGRSL